MPADLAVKCAAEVYSLGISAILVLDYQNTKLILAQVLGIWIMDRPVQKIVKARKQAIPDLTIIPDMCLCQDTTHGHCGVIKNNEIDNDDTLPYH